MSSLSKAELLDIARKREQFASNIGIEMILSSIDAAVRRREALLVMLHSYYQMVVTSSPYESMVDMLQAQSAKIATEEAILKELFMTLACAMNRIDPTISY